MPRVKSTPIKREKLYVSSSTKNEQFKAPSSCTTVLNTGLDHGAESKCETLGLGQQANELIPTPSSTAVQLITVANTIQSTATETQRLNAVVPRKSYTFQYKLDCLDLLDKNHGSLAKTSHETGVHRKSLRCWRNQRDRLTQAMESYCSTLRSKLGRPGRRRTFCMELETQLLQWAQMEQAMDRGLTYNRLQIKASAIAKDLNLERQNISIGWVQGFLRRNKLRVGRTTPFVSRLILNNDSKDVDQQNQAPTLNLSVSSSSNTISNKLVVNTCINMDPMVPISNQPVVLSSFSSSTSTCQPNSNAIASPPCINNSAIQKQVVEIELSDDNDDE